MTIKYEGKELLLVNKYQYLRKGKLVTFYEFAEKELYETTLEDWQKTPPKLERVISG